MSKIIEFKREDAEVKECKHNMLDITDDAIYCRDCNIGINPIWVVRNLSKIISSDYSSQSFINMHHGRLQVEERRKYQDVKSLELWLDELVKERDVLLRSITNKTKIIAQLNHENELAKNPQLF